MIRLKCPPLTNLRAAPCIATLRSPRLIVQPSPSLPPSSHPQPSKTSSRASRRRPCRAGAALFWEGDKAGQIFDVLEGVMRIYRIMSDGRRAIMGFVHPGDVLGVSFQDRYLFTAEAVTQVKVRRFARGRFFAMINESPALRPQLFAILCDEMSAAQDQMLLLGRKTAEERVVSFLLAIHRKSARGRGDRAANEPSGHGRLSRADDRDCVPDDDKFNPPWFDRLSGSAYCYSAQTIGAAGNRRR